MFGLFKKQSNQSSADFEDYNPLNTVSSKKALQQLISDGILNGNLVANVLRNLSDETFQYDATGIIMSYVNEFDLIPETDNLSPRYQNFLNIVFDIEKNGVQFMFNNKPAASRLLFLYATASHLGDVTPQNVICTASGQGMKYGLEFISESLDRARLMDCLELHGFTQTQSSDLISNIKSLSLS